MVRKAGLPVAGPTAGASDMFLSGVIPEFGKEPFTAAAVFYLRRKVINIKLLAMLFWFGYMRLGC